LAGFESASTTIHPGERINATLYWQTREQANLDLHAFVGLFAADGKLVASTDDPPIGNAFGTSRWPPGELIEHPIRLRVPANLAPGDYVLRVALYNPRTNEPLDASPSEFVANDQIVLMTVSVK